MNRFMAWHARNYRAIAWFLTGWMSFALLIDFSNGAWAECLLDILIIALNIYLAKK